MTAPPPAPQLADVRRAAERIAPRIHRTPVLTSRSLDALVGARLFFKAENLQRTGAFKMRGASNAVAQLEDPERGVATHSSGNHGAALALAAQQRGIRCCVVMPEGSTESKVAAVRAYGAEIRFCPPTQADRERVAAEVVAATGASLVHPYDDTRIIAGQATAALELLEQVPDLDLIVAPLGGGGLLSGTTITTAALRPRCRVLGAEPTGADDGQRSLRAGRITPLATVDTIADGLRATVGKLPFSILQQHRIEVETATDDEIRQAMHLLWSRLKSVVEPSAAVPLAVLLREPVEVADLRIGVILSGGNLDFGDP